MAGRRSPSLLGNSDLPPAFLVPPVVPPLLVNLDLEDSDDDDIVELAEIKVEKKPIIKREFKVDTSIRDDDDDEIEFVGYREKPTKNTPPQSTNGAATASTRPGRIRIAQAPPESRSSSPLPGPSTARFTRNENHPPPSRNRTRQSSPQSPLPPVLSPAHVTVVSTTDTTGNRDQEEDWADSSYWNGPDPPAPTPNQNQQESNTGASIPVRPEVEQRPPVINQPSGSTDQSQTLPQSFATDQTRNQTGNESAGDFDFARPKTMKPPDNGVSHASVGTSFVGMTVGGVKPAAIVVHYEGGGSEEYVSLKAVGATKIGKTGDIPDLVPESCQTSESLINGESGRKTAEDVTAATPTDSDSDSGYCPLGGKRRISHFRNDRQRHGSSSKEGGDRDGRHRRCSQEDDQDRRHSHYLKKQDRRYNAPSSNGSSRALEPRFKTEEDLISLLRTCTDCHNMRFQTRGEGTSHQKLQHNRKHCPVCFRRQSCKGNKWKDHLNEHHAVDGKEMARCPFCSKEYSFEGMYQHIGKAHLVSKERHFEFPPILSPQRSSDLDDLLSRPPGPPPRAYKASQPPEARNNNKRSSPGPSSAAGRVPSSSEIVDRLVDNSNKKSKPSTVTSEQHKNNQGRSSTTAAEPQRSTIFAQAANRGTLLPNRTASTSTSNRNETLSTQKLAQPNFHRSNGKGPEVRAKPAGNGPEKRPHPPEKSSGPPVKSTKKVPQTATAKTSSPYSSNESQCLSLNQREELERRFSLVKILDTQSLNLFSRQINAAPKLVKGWFVNRYREHCLRKQNEKAKKKS